MQTSGTNLVQHPLPTPELRGRRKLLGAAALTAALTLACSASWAQTAATAPVKGGAANLARRIRRVHFVAELLSHFDFATEISGDTLTARLEQGEYTNFLSALRILGYLIMHTRQLDMIMADEEALKRHRLMMMEDLLELAARPPLKLP